MYAERIAKLQAQNVLTGIDFVEVMPGQTVLRVHFHVDPTLLSVPFDPVDLDPNDFIIVSAASGERIPVVEIDTAAAGSDHVLVLTTAAPGDFSRYRLTIKDDRLDILFGSVEFSFKAGCGDTKLDCKPIPDACPPGELVDFPVDYLARDFLSLRTALLDLASQRYPEWREPIEADVGVMLIEVLAALGDELSYTQDRVAREAFLATATQRRSVRRLARVVDYNIHDGRSGTTWLDFQVNADLVVLDGDEEDVLRAGTRIWAVSDLGATIPFEIGTGLTDSLAATPYPLYEAWNTFAPHIFDEFDAVELPAGATEMYIQNPGGLVDDNDWRNKWVLITSTPTDPSKPARRHLVRVTAEDAFDELETPDKKQLLRLTWSEDQALPWCISLDPAVTKVHANIIPATAGERFTEEFAIRGDDPAVTQAVERQGPKSGATGEHAVIFLHSLLSTETGGLGWLGADLRAATPELLVSQIIAPGVYNDWNWRRTLLGSTPLEEHYTLDDGTLRRIVGFQRATIDRDFQHIDYASGDGFTLRFGDGEFGRTPADELKFRVIYRTGPGAGSNVSAGAIRHVVHPLTRATDLDEDLQLAKIVSVENPLPVTDGVDPEDLEQIKQLAPEEFRAITHRAVTPADYCDIVGRLPWVQTPGVRLRWTGSWPSYFVTPDPIGSYKVTSEQRSELTGLLDCIRQAGREVHTLDPRFRAIDLEIKICVKPGHIPSEVRDRVLRRLTGDGVRPGYFNFDTFTFGQPLHRFTLEGIVGAVPGVLGVREIFISARAVHERRELEPLYVVPDNEILRLANDPRTPERGSVRVYTEGGV